jgi:hypothetical protein
MTHGLPRVLSLLRTIRSVRSARSAAKCGSAHCQAYPFSDPRAYRRVLRELVQAGRRGLEQVFEVVKAFFPRFLFCGATHGPSLSQPSDIQRWLLCIVPDIASALTKADLSAAFPIMGWNWEMPERRGRRRVQGRNIGRASWPEMPINPRCLCCAARAPEMPKMRKSSLTTRLHHSGKGLWLSRQQYHFSACLPVRRASSPWMPAPACDRISGTITNQTFSSQYFRPQAVTTPALVSPE